MKEQLYYLLEKLVIQNNIRINREELKLQLLSHPSYPSLHALTGVLTHFGINNLALRLPASDATFAQLPIHFIAVVGKEEEEALVLAEKKNTKVELTFDQKKKEVISNEAFIERWNGILLAIEKDENVIESTESSFWKNARMAIAVLSGLFIGYLAYLNADLFPVVHILLSMFGLLISVFIVKHELGLQSTAVNNFCNLSPNTSCDAVLNSDGAKLFGLFKLSDTSMIVFMAYCFYWLLFFVNGSANFALLAIVSLLAIPVVAYSVYYQYRVVKKWCPLCLGIGAVLCLQATALLLTNFSIAGMTIHLPAFLFLPISFLAAIWVWTLLKPLLERNKTLSNLEVKHYQFKRNFSVFKALFYENKSLPNTEPIPHEIVLGKKTAALEIILVTSPTCFYCKGAHQDIHKLLKRVGDHIKVTIRFNVNVSDKEGKAYQTTMQLLDAYDQKGEAHCEKMLDEVYSENANLTHWLQKLKPVSNPFYDQSLEEQSRWCIDNDINFTPALFINGFTFPGEYERSDLIYFIEDLIELVETEVPAEHQQRIAS